MVMEKVRVYSKRAEKSLTVGFVPHFGITVAAKVLFTEFLY